MRNLIGKTFAFLVCVEKENVVDGKDSFRVSKLLSKDGFLAEQALKDSSEMVNPNSIISGDEVPSLDTFFLSYHVLFSISYPYIYKTLSPVFKVPLALTYSEEPNDSSTPSSKRVYASTAEAGEGSSTSKKLYVQQIDLAKPESYVFGVKSTTLNFDESSQAETDEKEDVEPTDVKVKPRNLKAIKVKIENKE